MRTALHDRHVALGAKMGKFAGWTMPMYYPTGTIAEHHAVRRQVGLFDVSHMGKITVIGPDAECFLDYISTNKIAGKAAGCAVYTTWASAERGSVDDVIVYKADETEFFVIVNVGNREKDLAHLRKHERFFQVIIDDRYAQDGILALQGPQADAAMNELFPEAVDLKFMRFDQFGYGHYPVTITRTGYTGEPGFEIIVSNLQIQGLWDRFLGGRWGVQPVGLGARDTLRLEMGFALYGNELTEEIAPTESVSAWTVKFDKEEFIGKEALVGLEGDSSKRSQHGVLLQGKGIARTGHKVYSNGEEIGVVTSGTWSPTLEKAIAIVMVKGKLQAGDCVDIAIRKNFAKAEVVELPFFKRKRS